MFREIIEHLNSSEFIYSHEVLEFFDEESIKLIKIKVHLKDGSTLFIRELIKANGSNYSYHWQDSQGKMLLRWDNAPYHPDV